MMRTKINFCVTAVLLAMCAAAGSSSAQATALTLAEAVARARVQAPQLQSADAVLRAADANIQISGLRPNPTLAVEAENVMGSGRYSGFGAAEKTVSLSMPLELGGKRPRKRIGSAASREGHDEGDRPGGPGLG